MAENLVNFDSSQILLENTVQTSNSITKTSKNTFSYITGQCLPLYINCQLSDDVARKLKSTHPPGRSPLLHNIASSIKRQLTAGISVKCDIQPLNDQRPCLAEDRECSWNSCPVFCSTLGNNTSKEKVKEAQLSADRTFYLLPVNCHIPELPLQCRKALLTVTVRPCSRNLPVWLSSPTKPEASVLDIHDSEGKPVYGKKEEITLRIKHPPVMFCQLQSPGNRHMVFLKVINLCSYCVKLIDCTIIPKCGPKCSRKHINKETSPKSKGTCVVHSNLIKDMSWAAQLLPACLLPSEELSLCAELDLTQLPSAFSKEEMAFEACLKWSIHDSKGKDRDGLGVVTTYYRLPSVCVKKGLFIVSAVCETQPVNRGERFEVTFSIKNSLQDFLSVKLNWNPTFADGDKEKCDHLLRGLLCEEPCVELGSCMYGETTSATVAFLALRPGVYEVCKHMKLNLRYLIPGSDNSSLASRNSLASVRSDDLQLLNAPFENLWRSRSGSRSSCGEMTGSRQELKMTTGQKSLSVSDLGPGSVEDMFKVTGSSQRSPMLQKREVQGSNLSPAQYEQLLLNPGNFIKNSCVVKVVCPD
ncbi:trafficking protein particle complex subunit 14-like [Mya arenaria]|uniref:trafficking protein particle complex subunit 14-like n=1 Tax=Mya arenaria TaxID=6604 RepID=UPI0022E2F051|nr:trafficking protein particle complex subunit 14-like [Mya arenaria]